MNNDDAFVVTRHLVLDRALPEATAESLRELPGMREVRVEPRGTHCQLQLHYDARHTGIDAVLSLLANAGLQPQPGLRQRWRLGRYRFTEQNLRDNAAFEPGCCSKPPRRS